MTTYVKQNFTNCVMTTYVMHNFTDEASEDLLANQPLKLKTRQIFKEIFLGEEKEQRASVGDLCSQ